jgi:muramoyltetrapeptide carboxypeptidase
MKNSLTPPFLKPGDSVAIVATARKISTREIEPAIEILKSKGYKVVLSKNLFKENNQFSGTDKQRTQDLQNALNNTHIKAIFVARGGYGTARILDELDYTQFIKEPKWIIGFSDITALLMDVYEKTKIKTIHGPMPLTFKWDKNSLDQTFSALSGKQVQIRYRSNNMLNQLGTVKAKLVGGNLSVLYSSASTLKKSFSKPYILFLEDLDEYLYHIDRMMLALKRGGYLKNMVGLVCGSFSEMKDNTIPFGTNAQQIISNYLPKTCVAIAFDFPSGHDKINLPIIIGSETILSVTKKEVLFLQHQNQKF